MDGAGPAEPASAPSRYLFIVADDFGYCTERDRGIIEGFASGGISAASLLVNGAHAADGVAAAVAVGLPLGLHFNLTEGLPVNAQPRSSLVGADGLFRGKQGFFDAVDAEQIRPDDIVTELVAQLERFQTLTGYAAQRIDGHNHIHVLPVVARMITPALAARSVSTIRIPFEHVDADTDPPLSPFLHRVNALSPDAAHVYRAAGIVASSNGFLGLRLMGRSLSVKAIVSELDAMGCLSGAVVELMTHPGHPARPGVGGCGGEAGPDSFALSSDRARELAVLTTESLPQQIQRVGFTLWTPDRGWPRASPLSTLNVDAATLLDTREFLMLDAAGALAGDPSLLLRGLTDQLEAELLHPARPLQASTLLAVSKACAGLVALAIPQADRLVGLVLRGSLEAQPLWVSADEGGGAESPQCALDPSFLQAVSARHQRAWCTGLPTQERAALWIARPTLLVELMAEEVEGGRPLDAIEARLQSAGVIECCAKYKELAASLTQSLRSWFHETSGEWRVIRMINCLTRLAAGERDRYGTIDGLFPPPPTLGSSVLAGRPLQFGQTDPVVATGAVVQQGPRMLSVEPDALGLFFLEHLIWIECLVLVCLPGNGTPVAATATQTAAAVLRRAFSGRLAADVAAGLRLLECATVAALGEAMGTAAEQEGARALWTESPGHGLLIGLVTAVSLKHNPGFDEVDASTAVSDALWPAVVRAPGAAEVVADYFACWTAHDPSCRPAVLAAGTRGCLAALQEVQPSNSTLIANLQRLAGQG